MNPPSSISPLMIRMLLIGNCHSIRSERRPCQEFEPNLAYRCICKLGLEDAVPDHSAAYRSKISGQRTVIDGRRHESGETLTLLCACHDPARCHRTVLADLVLAD